MLEKEMHSARPATPIRVSGSARRLASHRTEVRLLGRVELTVAGEPVRSAGKAQQRLLDLLRVLAAAGAAGKSQHFLENRLWAGCESPRAALAVAVHRLRKLLGDDAAVIVHGGLVSLNSDAVWTDLDALAALCQAIDTMPASEPADELEHLADALISLYRGGLGGDEDDPWLVAMQRRIATNFVAAGCTLGERLEAAGLWRGAGRLYRRLIDAEPLSETAYRGLMRCAHAQGDPAAAFSFYRYCRDTLSVLLGREPSPQTRQLALALGLLGPADVHAQGAGMLRARGMAQPHEAAEIQS